MIRTRRIPLLMIACLLWGSPATAVTLSIACGSTGKELELCRQGTEAWARATGNEVSLVSAPVSSSERLALYQQLLAAKDDSIDVFQIDVIWPGMLYKQLLDLTDRVPEKERKEHFAALVANNTVMGKLIALPWFTDAGLLYYRRDLLNKYRLPVPETWKDLTYAAEVIQSGERKKSGGAQFYGYVWQGKAYEGLTCDALEWLVSTGAGRIVEKDGTISVDNPRTVAALQMAAKWVGTISPRGVLNYGEEEGRGVFQSGQAAFMRNWPYAWSLLQSKDSPVAGKVGVAVLPRGVGKGSRHTATLGGWQLGVSLYSKHPDEAVSLVRYLTSFEEQKRRAVEGGFNPTRPDLYKDEDVIRAVPFFKDLYPVFVSAVPRPTITGRKYNQVSSAFVNAAHDVLSGRKTAEEALRQLTPRLERLRGDGSWGAL